MYSNLPRTLKRVFVPEHVVFALLSWRPGRPLTMPVYDDVPDDAVVERVGADTINRGWWVMVSHPSFPEVPNGTPVPLVASEKMVPVGPVRWWPATGPSVEPFFDRQIRGLPGDAPEKSEPVVVYRPESRD